MGIERRQERIPDAHDLLLRPPGRNIVCFNSSGGHEASPDNQFVAPDSKSANGIFHACPERRPNRTIPGRNIIDICYTGCCELSGGNQFVVIDGQSEVLVGRNPRGFDIFIAKSTK